MLALGGQYIKYSAHIYPTLPQNPKTPKPQNPVKKYLTVEDRLDLVVFVM